MTESTSPPRILRTFAESSPAAKALLAGIFVNRFGGFLQIFLVLFMTTRGYTGVQAGLALGAYGAGSVLGVLVGGTLSDRLGARTTVLASTVGSTIPLLAVYYVHNYPALLTAVVLVGAVSQMFRPAAAALLSALTPADRQVMISAMYRFALNLGTTAAPLIGAALIAGSYAFLFWGEAIAALVYAAIAAVTLPRHLPATHEHHAADESTGGSRALLRDHRFLLYLAAMLINCTIYVQYLGTLPLAMRSAGYAAVWYAVMVALNGFIVISCELLVTKFVQRRPARAVMCACLILLGGGYAVYAVPGGLGVFFIGTILWSTAEIVGGPTIFAYPATIAPAAHRGRYIGATHAMFGLGSAIGPALGVGLWTVIGRPFWLCCGALAALGIMAAWLGVRSPAPAVETGAPEPSTHEMQDEHEIQEVIA